MDGDNLFDNLLKKIKEVKYILFDIDIDIIYDIYMVINGVLSEK